MAAHKGRRDKRKQAVKAHAIIRGVEDSRDTKLTNAQKRKIIAATGNAPYPPRRGQPRKWARRVIAQKHKA